MEITIKTDEVLKKACPGRCLPVLLWARLVLTFKNETEQNQKQPTLYVTQEAAENMFSVLC